MFFVGIRKRGSRGLRQVERKRCLWLDFERQSSEFVGDLFYEYQDSGKPPPARSRNAESDVNSELRTESPQGLRHPGRQSPQVAPCEHFACLR
jgi:hypothetical protein